MTAPCSSSQFNSNLLTVLTESGTRELIQHWSGFIYLSGDILTGRMEESDLPNGVGAVPCVYVTVTCVIVTVWML